ncbi:hypothetical protein Unana1_05599 [Umbelopsis nana]
MSGLFRYPTEDSYEEHLDELEPDELEEYKLHKALFHLAGVFQHNQDEFGVGDLKAINQFELERRNIHLTRFKTSDELRESSLLEELEDFDYDTDQKLSKQVLVYVIKDLLLSDLSYRFGPTAFSNYIIGLQSSRQDETARILVAAQKSRDRWIPWLWIKDMSLLCENEFSSLYTAYVKPPFVVTHMTGQKVYKHKVTDTNIALKIYDEIEENRSGRDHLAITFDPANSHVHFVAFSGEFPSGDEAKSLEQELASPFNGWAHVLAALRYMSIFIIRSQMLKLKYHGQFHPKKYSPASITVYLASSRQGLSR